LFHENQIPGHPCVNNDALHDMSRNHVEQNITSTNRAPETKQYISVAMVATSTRYTHPGNSIPELPTRPPLDEADAMPERMIPSLSAYTLTATSISRNNATIPVVPDSCRTAADYFSVEMPIHFPQQPQPYQLHPILAARQQIILRSRRLS